MVLIVGGDSLIGSALAAALRTAAKSVAVTTRREGGEGLMLDLGADPGTWELPVCEAAVICGAMTRLRACEEEPVMARRVNVENTAALTGRLHRAGTHVVFPSTNLVFDGTRSRPMAEDAVCPVTGYGRLKAEAEVAVGEATEGKASVLRLTKVLSPEQELVAQWRQALAAGEAIEAFTDMPVAPVGLRAVVEAIGNLVEHRPRGIFHLSADRDVKWVEVARRLCEAWRCDPGLIRGVKAAERGLRVPQHSALGMGAREAALGMRPQDPWAVGEGLGKMEILKC